MVATSMVSSTLLVTVAATLASAKTVQFGSHGQYPVDHEMLKRSLVTNGNTLNGKTYDYVVIGGGLAGLTVASRLSENSNVTVAVIEAGQTGYDDNEKFVVPAANLYNSAVGTSYDWRWNTTAQDGLNGRSASWPRGKVLGGSSAINGLYYVRHSEIEQNAWANLNGQGPDDTWGWNNMFKAMMKSEKFTPPTQDVLDIVDIQYDASSHGTNGSIHTTWPGKTYAPISDFLKSVASLGTPVNPDPASGKSWGAFVATSTINPSNWTRSYSRTGYLDPYTYRSNLHVLTGYTVTKILFNGTASHGGNITATGVQYSAYSGSDLLTVHAAREVILSGGTVNDPQVLQLSGIGSSELLKQHNVPVVLDLPGVGYNVQDHVSSRVVFTPTQQADVAPQKVTNNALTDSYVNSAIAYVSASTLFGDNQTDVLDAMKSAQQATVAALDAPDTVKQGYNLTYGVQVNDITSSDVGVIELLFAISFGGLQVQAALQRPLSRGSILIQSNDPFASPAIDAGYLSNAFDLETIRAGFKLARTVGTTAPLSSHMGAETMPGTGVSSDSEWDNWIRSNVGTEYHPSGSCSMLPLSAGGVVGTDLKVHGTTNLRVIDAAVIPFSLTAHLMAATYGLAEIGAELILQDREKALNASSSKSSSSKPVNDTAQRNSNTSPAAPSAVRYASHTTAIVAACLVAAVFALAL
ncbi:hypothetical protein ACQY0O_008242 [Thecaphora frezii]|nr:putative GMC oxidoreductase [Thecaphora frezii]